ncbi:MAG: AI-2E family transporter [Acidimicrobiia bacterium]|nr:AI-2E family transporter [Acidimicrobiia bacterium]
MAQLAAYGWRLIVLVAVLAGVLWLLGQLWVALLALVVALFLSRALIIPAGWLRGRGAPPLLASWVSLLGFLGVVGLAGSFIVPAVVSEFRDLGPTLSEAVDDVQEWLVDDAPVDIDERDIERARTDVGDAVGESLRSSGSSILSGALTVLEVLTGLLLALVTTFFFLKDGRRFQTFVLARVAPEHRPLARRMAARAWTTLGGYLRGAALLGVLESAVIGVTLQLVGGDLVAPVMVLTFAAAFVPFVGAVVAGAVAVLVALGTAGPSQALVVVAVAVAVQQLDNDFLAPYVYGRALELHPLVVLFSIVAGGALFGFAGTVLAVPVVAVIVNVSNEVGVGKADEASVTL